MADENIKTTPWDFFIHLLVFASLYASVVSFLALIFGYINLIFPDNLGFYGDYAGEIIGPSSVLIIIFPVFIFTSWLLGKELADIPKKREVKFRKWLVYFTLFAAAITIIVDLIGLVSGFYNGELTARFLLKVLTVLATAATVFWYYFWDLKRAGDLKTNKPKLAAWTVSLIVLAAIIGGFLTVGTPAHQRAKRFDRQRVNDLQIIQNQLVNYWTQKEKLPEKTVELTADQLSGFVLPTDPETETDYEYKKLTALSFELCAVFKTDDQDNSGGFILNKRNREWRSQKSPPVKLVANQSKPQFWTLGAGHNQGRVCFMATIDPELYKKTP